MIYYIKLSLFSFLIFCFSFTYSQKAEEKKSAKSEQQKKEKNEPASGNSTIENVKIIYESSNVSSDKNDKKLPLNAAVRFGKLENGLTYYIQHNKKPENRVEFRLVVNAGSNQEEETQKGLAHFVEHMAFNGSKHFSKNELVNYLESIGTKFGAHLNAYTSFDETVYMIQLPTDKKEILEKGLLVLEDWASALSFDTTEIDKERGVVFSEWRSGLGANKRMMDKYLPVMYYKSRYAERLPIGDTAILLRAPYERLTSFYQNWYRPDLMAVIIVGDIDTEEMEKEIQKRFGGLLNPKNELKKEIFTLPEHNELMVSVCTDPEATYSRAMLFYKHATNEENTKEGFRIHLMNSLFNNMLNNRLQEIMQQPSPPYFAAYSGYGRETRANDAFSLTAVTQSGKTIDALKVILTEAQRLRQHGFTQTELDRQKTEILTSYKNALQEKDKTESGSLVSEYVAHFLENIPAPGIELESELAESLIPEISLEEINMLPQKYISEENTVIVLTAPETEKKFLPWEDEIKQIAEKIKSTTFEAYTDKVIKEQLMDETPNPSEIISEKINEKYNITTLEFKNGVRVLLKPTNFKNDEILMNAYSPGGTSLYSDNDYMSADYSNAIVYESGVSTFDKLSLQKALTGKTASLYPYVGELNEGFKGSSNIKDLETMLQLTYLYFTKPRKSAEDYKTFISKEINQYEHILDNPSMYFSDKFQNIIFNKNIRRGVTTLDKIKMVDFEKSFSIYQERFKDASDFTFIFTGNIDIKKIKPLLEIYLGGLPSEGKKETWKDPGILKKEGLTESRVKMGKTQKDLVGIHYHGSASWSEEDYIVFISMIKILNIQLREAIREDKGGVYGVSVNGSFEERPKNEYGITIQFNTEPSRVEELIKAVYYKIEELINKPVSDEYINKVQETQRREREAQLKENTFWVNVIQYYDEHGKDINKLDNYETLINELSAEKIQLAFKKYFGSAHKIELILEPEK